MGLYTTQLFDNLIENNRFIPIFIRIIQKILIKNDTFLAAVSEKKFHGNVCIFLVLMWHSYCFIRKIKFLCQLHDDLKNLEIYPRQHRQARQFRRCESLAFYLPRSLGGS